MYLTGSHFIFNYVEVLLQIKTEPLHHLNSVNQSYVDFIIRFAAFTFNSAHRSGWLLHAMIH